ncbi:hypothetical protein EYF80_053708 [Liparis tanakae]|uniref:Uncharacterized protein n=1 Tax=Liparis tanakae TaxID=230148 RepID=A0A4Z2F4H9_9TELE|nr:hypothetical protein EYF80_053708 [Liparis tanakae]
MTLYTRPRFSSIRVYGCSAAPCELRLTTKAPSSRKHTHSERPARLWGLHPRTSTLEGTPCELMLDAVALDALEVLDTLHLFTLDKRHVTVLLVGTGLFPRGAPWGRAPRRASAPGPRPLGISHPGERGGRRRGGMINHAQTL